MSIDCIAPISASGPSSFSCLILQIDILTVAILKVAHSTSVFGAWNLAVLSSRLVSQPTALVALPIHVVVSHAVHEPGRYAHVHLYRRVAVRPTARVLVAAGKVEVPPVGERRFAGVRAVAGVDRGGELRRDGRPTEPPRDGRERRRRRRGRRRRDRRVRPVRAHAHGKNLAKLQQVEIAGFVGVVAVDVDVPPGPDARLLVVALGARSDVLAHRVARVQRGLRHVADADRVRREAVLAAVGANVDLQARDRVLGAHVDHDPLVGHACAGAGAHHVSGLDLSIDDVVDAALPRSIGDRHGEAGQVVAHRRARAEDVELAKRQRALVVAKLRVAIDVHVPPRARAGLLERTIADDRVLANRVRRVQRVARVVADDHLVSRQARGAAVGAIIDLDAPHGVLRAHVDADPRVVPRHVLNLSCTHHPIRLDHVVDGPIRVA